MHHLLTHSSGLATGTEDAPTGLGAAARLRDMPPTFPPGERFWYSNDGYKLVGLVLEAVTGTPIHRLLHQRVLVPLEMTGSVAAIDDAVRTDLATGYEPMFTDRPAQLRHPLVPATFTVSNTADGSIASSVIDMAAYARLLLNRGRGPQGEVLSDAMFARLTSPLIELPDDPGTSYGYGLDIGQDEHGPRIGHSGGMVGYTAYLAVEPDSGIGIVILQNGSGSKAGLTRVALDAVRACLRDQPLLEAWAPPAPTAIPDAGAFAGDYRSEDGDTLSVRVEGDGLSVVLGKVSARLERDPLGEPGDTFVIVHPELELFALRFGRDADGRVVEAFHGNAWFRGERYEGEAPEPPPEEWSAYPGLYRNDDPWCPTLRLVLRKGRLALQWPVELSDEEGDIELRPLGDGWFAVNEPWQPRRIRFDRIVDGRAVIAEFNGGRWYRSFED